MKKKLILAVIEIFVTVSLFADGASKEVTEWI